MKKHWGMFVTVVGFLLLFTWTVFAEQPAQDLKPTEDALHFIIDAMKQSGAEPDKIQLHYGTPYRTYPSMEDVKDLAKKLRRDMGLTAETSNRPDEFGFTRDQQGVHTELRVIGVASPDNKTWESYVTVRMTAGYNGLKPLESQLLSVYNVLVGVQILPQFNSCVQGKYSGTLKNDVQLAKMNQLFGFMGATVVEKVEDPTVMSYSGFTSEISPFIWTNGNKMNVQAGLHVDHLEKVTRLTIGTPIITMEY